MIESTIGGVTVAGAVVETEAYLGPDDPASHAAVRAGVTRRNRAMFGEPGRAYVYLSHGIHWCLNAVTGAEGDPQAVLFRGLDPLRGREAMIRRRGRRIDLANGPGKLCQALAVSMSQYGHDLAQPPLRILRGWDVPDARVRATGRIGVRRAADRPWRFLVVDGG